MKASASPINVFWLTFPKGNRNLNNSRIISVIFFLLLAGFPAILTAQTTYTWDGSSSLIWATAANWTPDRNTPANNDILIFNNGASMTIDDVPAQTIGRLNISGNTNITLRPPTTGSSTLTVSAAASDALTVASGSTLTISGRDAGTDRTLTLTTANTAGLQANISGTLRVARDNNQAGATGSFTRGGANAVINFNSGSVYEHAVNGGALPIATWNVASTCLITGITATIPTAATFNQTFGNLTWNSASQTVNAALGGNLSRVDGTFTMASTGATGYFRPQGNATYGNYIQTGGNYRLATQSTAYVLTIPGNVTLNGGTMNLSNTGAIGTLSVAGNFTFPGGTITELSTGSGLIVFNGSGTQIFTSGGTLSNLINFTVNSGSTLQMGTGASPSVINGSTGTFTLSSGATLGITSPVGISSSGAAGNIQVTGTRTYDAGANYIYNGTGAQITGSGLPVVAITGNVTVASGSTVTTTNAVTANGILNIGGTLIPGAADQVIGGNGTLTGTGTAVVNRTASTADFSSQYTVSNQILAGLTINYAVPAGGQTVSALTYGNLTIGNTSGTNTLAGNVTVNGTTTTAAGGILDIGTNELTINNLDHNGVITINSTALNVSGSMIASGTVVQSPGAVVTYNRFMRLPENRGDYHYFSSPVVSNSQANEGKITDVWQWNEATGDWSTLSITALASGSGYNLDQDPLSDGIITFTGSLATEDINVEVSSPYSDIIDGTEENYDSRVFAAGRDLNNYGGGGWNMLGNPYTSAILASDFINGNAASFDPNYTALYLFDGSVTPGVYYYLANSTGWPNGTQSTETHIQAGQGFFVLAMNDNTSFTFNRGMQDHNQGAIMFKSSGGNERWPGLELTARLGKDESRTTIVFNEGMTAGLDPGYDVGQFSSGVGVGIYTTLVKDNGINFARQALPVADCERNIIALGTDSEKGGWVTFSAVTVPLAGYKYYLEDRQSGTFTDLGMGSLTVRIPANTYGTGRFYIHVSVLTGIPSTKADPSQEKVRVWAANRQIIVRGIVSDGAFLQIFDMRGSKVWETGLDDAEVNIINMPFSAKGLYIVRITDGLVKVTKKVVFP